MVLPHVAVFEVIVLSEDQLMGLTALHGMRCPIGDEESPADAPDEPLALAMKELQGKWGCKRVALCRKRRDASGLQQRWSVLVESGGVTSSTAAAPVWHRPREDLGGGSAWLAGLLDGLAFHPTLSALAALRRADLLAALCQESTGDFSQVSGAELQASEQRYPSDAAAHLCPDGGSSQLLQSVALPSREEASRRIEATLEQLKQAGVIAILRAKGSPEVAISRALELAKMGCKAIEVTMDSTDWPHVLSEMRRQLPADIAIGIGTVMDDTVCDLQRAAALGATFALSPIDPIGFVEECQRRGILAVPAGFTANECWRLHARGARLIKLFHASTISPAILKAMLDVGPLRAMNILPSGGVSPENMKAWWEAGAVCVGMGSNLVGPDVGIKKGESGYDAAAKKWEASREVANGVFAAAKQRKEAF